MTISVPDVSCCYQYKNMFSSCVHEESVSAKPSSSPTETDVG